MIQEPHDLAAENPVDDPAMLALAQSIWEVLHGPDWQTTLMCDAADAMKVAAVLIEKGWRQDVPLPAEDAPEGKLRIFMNSNAKMSRGKYAAHAVHAALMHFGVHPDVPVVVLGAKPREIEQMTTVIHDAGHTELEPGTLTAGTDGVA